MNKRKYNFQLSQLSVSKVILLLALALSLNACTSNYDKHMQAGTRGIALPDKSTYYGNFKNGLFHGQGTLIWNNNKRYTGFFKSGKFDGYGQLTWPDGTVYKGNFKNGLKHGYGKYISKDSIYEGTFFEDYADGIGKVIKSHVGEYIGDIHKGRYHGYGRFNFENGDVYIGPFIYGSAHGEGVCIRTGIKGICRYENDVRVSFKETELGI